MSALLRASAPGHAAGVPETLERLAQGIGRYPSPAYEVAATALRRAARDYRAVASGGAEIDGRTFLGRLDLLDRMALEEAARDAYEAGYAAGRDAETFDPSDI